MEDVEIKSHPKEALRDTKERDLSLPQEICNVALEINREGIKFSLVGKVQYPTQYIFPL